MYVMEIHHIWREEKDICDHMYIWSHIVYVMLECSLTYPLSSSTCITSQVERSSVTGWPGLTAWSHHRLVPLHCIILFPHLLRYHPLTYSLLLCHHLFSVFSLDVLDLSPSSLCSLFVSWMFHHPCLKYILLDMDIPPLSFCSENSIFIPWV